MKTAAFIFISLLLFTGFSAEAGQKIVCPTYMNNCPFYFPAYYFAVVPIIPFAPFLVSLLAIAAANTAERWRGKAVLLKPLLQHPTFFWLLLVLIFGIGFSYTYMSVLTEETANIVRQDYFEQVAKKHSIFLTACAVYLLFYLYVGLFVYALFCHKKERPLPFILRIIPKQHIKRTLQAMGCIAGFFSLYLLFLVSQFYSCM